jgi:hypothetical protein
MAGVNVDPTNPNPALLQLAKDRGLKVFGLPYTGEGPKLTWREVMMGNDDQIKAAAKAMGLDVDTFFEFNNPLAEKGWDVGSEVQGLIGNIYGKESRQPWKSMMTSENPTGGEWVEKGIQTTEHATENEAKRTQYIKDAIKYYQKTLADDLPDDENEAFEYLYSLAHNKATEVFPYEKSVTKNYLTSSELPGNVNYKYSGQAFPSE